MRFYSMTLADIMNMPIYTFWHLYGFIDRIRSEEELRQFVLLQHIIGGEAKDYVHQLKTSIGNPVDHESDIDSLDKAGLKELKNLMGF